MNLFRGNVETVRLVRPRRMEEYDAVEAAGALERGDLVHGRKVLWCGEHAETGKRLIYKPRSASRAVVKGEECALVPLDDVVAEFPE